VSGSGLRGDGSGFGVQGVSVRACPCEKATEGERAGVGRAGVLLEGGGGFRVQGLGLRVEG
jgi:hypothetical protein